MESPDVNPVELMVNIIKEHSPEDIWQESPLIGYRNLGNTNRGEIGEEFIRRYLKAAKIPVSNGGRTSATDMQIAGQPFRGQDRLDGSKPDVPIQPRAVGQGLRVPALSRNLPE